MRRWRPRAAGDRNDYPVRAMWRALIAGVVFQHASIQSLLRELGRNPALLEICGFDPLPFQAAPVTELRGGRGGPRAVTHPARVRSTVPGHWNFSRFLGSVVRLEDERGLVSGMIGSLRAALFEEVPGFGRHLGYDGKALASHSTGRVAEDKGKTSDPDADWGRHETSGVNARTGAIWKKVTSWFGYGLHLIADTHHEVPVAFAVTRASASEPRVLPGMLEELFGEMPRLAERCADFSADRGLDNAPLKKKLWDKWTIRPLVDTRLMWKVEKEDPDYDPKKPITRALFPERTDIVVHYERGRVSCVCPATGEIRAMAFQGFEAGRGPSGTIKYRCPAAAFDLDCKGRRACHRAGGVKPGAYGRIVRVDLDKHDRRIFTPTPWGSPSWRRGYNRHSAMERINARLDRGFNFETHYIRGLARMKTRVGLALAVMMAMALAHARAGRAERMRSLVGAVPYRDTG